MPKKNSEQAAAFDLYIPEGIQPERVPIYRGQVFSIPLGFSTEIPEGYYGQIQIRSSLGKKGLIIPNAPGIVDSDYRGEWKMMLWNLLSEPYVLIGGDRVAQVIFLPCPNFTWKEVEPEKLTKTRRGYGGFGSTGR